jgi:hypothetical protein
MDFTPQLPPWMQPSPPPLAKTQEANVRSYNPLARDAAAASTSESEHSSSDDDSVYDEEVRRRRLEHHGGLVALHDQWHLLRERRWCS